MVPNEKIETLFKRKMFSIFWSSLSQTNDFKEGGNEAGIPKHCYVEIFNLLCLITRGCT